MGGGAPTGLAPVSGEVRGVGWVVWKREEPQQGKDLVSTLPKGVFPKQRHSTSVLYSLPWKSRLCPPFLRGPKDGKERPRTLAITFSWEGDTLVALPCVFQLRTVSNYDFFKLDDKGLQA